MSWINASEQMRLASVKLHEAEDEARKSGQDNFGLKLSEAAEALEKAAHGLAQLETVVHLRTAANIWQRRKKKKK